MGKYQEGHSMDAITKWVIENMTNLDASSLTAFEETTISGICIIMVLQFVVILFK